MKTIRRDWLKRQIIKGNIEIKCDQILTDDYAFDAAMNFQKSDYKKANIEDFSDSDFKYGSGYASLNEDGTINWAMLCNHYYTCRLIKTFETGKIYLMSWVGDSELKTPYKVIKRTAKMITVESHGEQVRCKINIYEGVEQISPTGKYSMSPILRADKVQKNKPVLKIVKNQDTWGVGTNRHPRKGDTKKMYL